jgi:hypothetical protein
VREHVAVGPRVLVGPPILDGVIDVGAFVLDDSPGDASLVFDGRPVEGDRTPGFRCPHPDVGDVRAVQFHCRDEVIGREFDPSVADDASGVAGRFEAQIGEQFDERTVEFVTEAAAFALDDLLDEVRGVERDALTRPAVPRVARDSQVLEGYCRDVCALETSERPAVERLDGGVVDADPPEIAVGARHSCLPRCRSWPFGPAAVQDPDCEPSSRSSVGIILSYFRSVTRKTVP